VLGRAHHGADRLHAGFGGQRAGEPGRPGERQLEVPDTGAADGPVAAGVGQQPGTHLDGGDPLGREIAERAQPGEGGGAAVLAVQHGAVGGDEAQLDTALLPLRG